MVSVRSMSRLGADRLIFDQSYMLLSLIVGVVTNSGWAVGLAAVPVAPAMPVVCRKRTAWPPAVGPRTVVPGKRAEVLLKAWGADQ